MNTNIDVAVAQKRVEIGTIGKCLGTQFFQVDVRVADLDYAKKQAEVAANGNKDFVLNRVPNRYMLRSIEVHNVSIDVTAAGVPSLFINKHEDGLTADITIPIGDDMTNFSQLTRTALEEALRGDKSKVFADPKKLCEVVNELNVQEKKRLDALYTFIDNARKGCLSAIAANEKKVAEYEAQIMASAPTHNPVEGKKTVTIDVNIENSDN